MRFTLGVVVVLIFSLECRSHDNSGVCNILNDRFALESLKIYQAAYNNTDSNIIKDWSVNQEYFDWLLADLTARNLSCLTEFDKTYSVRKVIDEFSYACQLGSGYRIDSIVPVKASRLDGCGGVVYKKVDARMILKKNGIQAELPLTLVFLLISDDDYKLMMQIANFKILSNEQ